MLEANPYYDPEKCGLTVLDTLEDPNAHWSFNTVVLWKDNQSGRLYWGADSGCSCPTPFEDYRCKADLLAVSETKQQLLDAVERHPAGEADKQKFLRRARVR